VIKPKNNCITIDMIGISGTYKGGASIFAQTFLSEFISNFESEIKVVLPKHERNNYSIFQSNRENVTFHYFESRDNIIAKIIFRIATQVLRSRLLLEQVQRYRWKEVIEFIEENSRNCLSLSAYISFPLRNVRHYCTLHDIQERTLSQFFSYKEKSIRKTNVLNTLHNVTGLQVSSEFVRNEIIRFYPRESAEIDFRIIPEGYSSLELKPTSSSYVERAETIRIIMPANFWPHKDHETLFKALRLFNNDFNLEVFCTGSMLDKSEKISSLVKDYNLLNVKFTGYLSREELINLYRSSHIVLSCSMYESSSLPILEGAVLGCIPIASDIPPHIEMAHRLEMHLFELGNFRDLHKVLSKVISEIQSKSSITQDINSKRVLGLSWKALMPKYLDFMLSKSVPLEGE
jgi:glycosyltransferase involved in cell wall biosynthesis